MSDHQTMHKHYLTVCATENRVSGNHLSTKQQDDNKLKSLENGKFCKEKIISNLTERALVKNIP